MLLFEWLGMRGRDDAYIGLLEAATYSARGLSSGFGLSG